MDWLKFRASAAAPLFLGEDGLTKNQLDKIEELIAKEKRTEIQEQTLIDLIKKRDAPIELSKGAKSYIESVVDEYVYGYKDSVDNKYTRKGTLVEDSEDQDYNKSDIQLANVVLFKDYVKSNSYLKKGHFHGHPDIEDEEEQEIADVKSSWNKKTFPKKPEDGENSTYEWQGKLYCYMKGWYKFKLIYGLMSTPEEMVPDWEHPSLHYVDDLPINLRITVINYTLLPEDIAKIEKREKAAVKYAEEYYNYLINKNKNV